MKLKNEIVGEWRLINFTIENTDGNIRSWGNNTHGILIYTINGYMSVSINGEDTSDLQNNKKILFYAGRYENVNENMMVHYVMNASDTNRISKTLLREIIFENEILSIIAKGDYGIATLRWMKI